MPTGDVRTAVGCACGAVGDDRVMRDDVTAAPEGEVPRVPASAGALIFDREGRLLVLKPNYKKGWTIPGGQIDAGGESPGTHDGVRSGRSAVLRSPMAGLCAWTFFGPSRIGPEGFDSCLTAARLPSSS